MIRQNGTDYQVIVDETMQTSISRAAKTCLSLASHEFEGSIMSGWRERVRHWEKSSGELIIDAQFAELAAVGGNLMTRP